MENLESLLRELAQELGTTTEFLWKVLIRQAQIEAIEAGLAVLVSAVLWFVTYKAIGFILPRWEDIQYDSEKEFISITIMGGLLIGSIIVTVAAVVGLTELPTLLFNPEYWALQQVLEALK